MIKTQACGKKTKQFFNLVENNYDEIVAACKNKDSKALLAIDGIKRVRIVGGYVLVYCNGAGIATSSQDYGFYYSETHETQGTVLQGNTGDGSVC